MWPFNRTKQKDIGRTIGGEEPRPFKLPAKRPAKHQTTADVLDWYCQQHNATYERTNDNGIVRVRVMLPDGDVFSGKGATTLEAVTAVVKKLEAK